MGDLKAKVSALESNLQDQLSTSTSQNMEILDLMDKLDKAYDQRDLCESKLINVNVRENSFSKQIRDLTKDKEELLETVHQIDKAHTQNSDNILEATKDSYEKIATINEEAELIAKYANPAEDYPRHKDDISVLNKRSGDDIKDCGQKMLKDPRFTPNTEIFKR